MAKSIAMPSSTEVLAVLTKVTRSHKAWDYGHVKAFNLVEVEDFLAGRPGKAISGYGGGYHRSNQVKQILSSIGCMLVDQGRADAEVSRVYKALWAQESSKDCDYCHKPFKFAFMMGAPSHCNKLKCVLAAMRAEM